jgi:hypothetical protein
MEPEVINKRDVWTRPDDRQLFLETIGLLDVVRFMWRNPTMHVGAKYTTEEALAIFSAVVAIMRKIASRCDENGDPRA